ncbi:SDR family oxidoreductase [Caenimonas soli]|uniref:SDR family oxidoreductase n=1 Tax=Caenimonas soli TaxID=2735555 RepID=UPI0015531A72|nr:SDR family oxidoreductase [Caenimonas soli]NPC55267.1 SDR family oxidoreductase [Caenimonas soli]
MNTPRNRVLVTGGSAGIGASVCRLLDEAGWQVLNFDIHSPVDAAPCEWTRVDMADQDSLARALQTAIAQGPLLGLVNNVAAIRPAALEDTRLADFDWQVGVGARSALQCAQALVPAMRAAGRGRIVNVTSRAALGKELRSGYSAAKGALNALTRTWALELGAAGITVNAVAPGPINTEAFAAANPADSPRTRQILEGIPVRRLGTPDDVARAVAFFMGENNAFITGQVLHVCGGITVGLSQ